MLIGIGSVMIGFNLIKVCVMVGIIFWVFFIEEIIMKISYWNIFFVLFLLFFIVVCGGGDGGMVVGMGIFYVLMMDVLFCGFDYVYVIVNKVCVNVSVLVVDSDVGWIDIVLVIL